MINLIYGDNCYDCDREILERLKQNRLDKGANHILLVPDKFSVSMEKMVFNHLEIESFCDIEVYTLTRLANETIKKQNILDKTSAVMLIQKIILDNTDKFSCFAKAIKDSNFATTIYETINQLKSCKVSYNDLVKEGNDILSLKLKDIALIYEERHPSLTKPFSNEIFAVSGHCGQFILALCLFLSPYLYTVIWYTAGTEVLFLR